MVDRYHFTKLGVIGCKTWCKTGLANWFLRAGERATDGRPRDDSGAAVQKHKAELNTKSIKAVSVLYEQRYIE